MSKILKELKKYMKPFVPLKFNNIGSIASDENEFGDVKILEETEDKLVTELKLLVSGRTVRRLYFKSCLNQVQCEVEVINGKETTACLSDFRVYQCIVQIIKKQGEEQTTSAGNDAEIKQAHTQDTGKSKPIQLATSPNSTEGKHGKAHSGKLKDRSVLILGGGCSVLGDAIKENSSKIGLIKDVDIDPEMFILGRRFFRSKKHIKDKQHKMVVRDAYDFVVNAQHVSKFDYIIIDINGPEVTPPKPFWEEEFVQNLAKFCSENCTVFVNTLIAEKREQGEFLKRMGTVFQLNEIVSDPEEANVLLKFERKSGQ